MLTPLSDPPPGPRPPLPAAAAAAEQQTHTKWPPSSLRRRLSVAGRAGPPASPGARSRVAKARRSPLEGLPPSSATGTRVPRSPGARKAQRGHVTQPPAAILWSQFSGLGLVHIRRGKRAGRRWGVQRAGSGPRLQAPRRAARWRSGAAGAWLRAPAGWRAHLPEGSVQSPRGASEGPVTPTSGLRLISLPFLKGNSEGAPGLPRRRYIYRR